MSLKLTFRLMEEVRKDDSLEDCIRKEWNLTKNFFRLPNDLAEGVRAKLIDKDNKPKWKFSTLQQVPLLYTSLHRFNLVG